MLTRASVSRNEPRTSIRTSEPQQTSIRSHRRAAQATASPATALESSFSPVPGPTSGFDEVFRPNGALRAPYKRVAPLLHKRTKGHMANIQARTLRDFRGDNVLLGIPRMLSVAENQQLRQGVEQRAKAIRAFLNDHYSGEKRYLREKAIPDYVIDRILERSTESELHRYIDAEKLSFWYGPDVVRGPSGQFYVIEDNPGHVGGMGDLPIARKSYLRHLPEMKKVVESPDPKIFYDALVRDYFENRVGGDKVVFLRYANSESADFEDHRLQGIFKRYGIDTVLLGSSPGDLCYRHHIRVRADGAYLYTNDRKAGKIGMVVADLEPWDLEPGHPALIDGHIIRQAAEDLEEALTTRQAATTGSPVASEVSTCIAELSAILHQDNSAKQKARALKKYYQRVEPDYLSALKERGVPGLLRAFTQGKVALRNSPGSEMVGDKEFCMYVDALIALYLGETPILKSIPTKSFATTDAATGEVHLDKALVDLVFDDKSQNMKDYVIKRVDGRGGDGVWVGAKMNSWASFRALADIVAKEPSAYIVQRYIPLSQVSGNICDLRILAQVTPNHIEVAPVPWGRAIEAAGSNGKVNLSDLGGEQVVLIASSETEATGAASETHTRPRELSSSDDAPAAKRPRRACAAEHEPFRLHRIAERPASTTKP